ncbi:MAG: ROK family protein [Bacteroidetes bacterium]|nr:ROK family protein [Bacteroidota bacterium]
MISIGIDIGGTAIKGVLTDSDRGELARTQRPTLAAESRDATITQLHACIEELSAQSPMQVLAGIGLGVPGAIDHAQGLVLHPPNLPDWDAVPLVDILARRWSVTVRLENDANCAALGERHYGAGKAHDHFVALTLGTGVGGGIIVNGRIYHGQRGFAGEFGHITLDPDGPVCNCGNRGCIEAYLGMQYLMREAIAVLRKDTGSVLHIPATEDADHLTPKDLSEAAMRGDQSCKNILHRAGLRLGIVIASVANLLDITTFIIGGGIAGAGAPLFRGIEESARTRVLKVHRDSLTILPAELGNDAGMLGAASLLR